MAFQLEELIKEVQVLREELRSRDKTIAQLTLQCQQLQQHQREQMVSWCELQVGGLTYVGEVYPGCNNLIPEIVLPPCV